MVYEKTFNTMDGPQVMNGNFLRERHEKKMKKIVKNLIASQNDLPTRVCISAFISDTVHYNMEMDTQSEFEAILILC